MSQTLSGKEQARFDQARSIIRGRLVRIGAILATITGGGVYLANKSASPPELVAPNSGNTPVMYSEKNIQAVNVLIQKVATGMTNLDNATRVERTKLGDFAKEHLEGPFDIIKMNVENPNINAPKFKKESLRRGESGYHTQNLYYFGYAEAELDDYAAAFSPSEKIMMLSSKLDPNNLLDMLVVYHELSHAVQDGNTRQKIRSREDMGKYIAFFKMDPGGKGRIVIIDEGSAYAREIEMLNILLKGTLKESITAGKGVDISSVQKALNSRPEQNGTIQMLIAMANTYYPEGLTDGNLPKKFLDHIAKLYRSRGYEVYIPVTSGGLRIYR